MIDVSLAECGNAIANYDVTAEDAAASAAGNTKITPEMSSDSRTSIKSSISKYCVNLGFADSQFTKPTPAKTERFRTVFGGHRNVKAERVPGLLPVPGVVDMVSSCLKTNCSMDHCNDPALSKAFPGNHIYDLLNMCVVNMGVGGSTALLNVPVLFIFLSNRKFRQDNKLLVALAIGDLCNCLGVGLMGLDRYMTYASIRADCETPTETSWTCARKPYLGVRVIGNLWPPAVQVVMGMERASSVLFPAAFKAYSNFKSYLSLLCTVLFAAIALSLGYLNSSLDRTTTVKMDCGRGAVFSKPFATFVYNTETIGYTVGFVLNMIAFAKALQIKKRINTTKSQRDIRRIRVCLLVTFVSLVLVAAPNAYGSYLLYFAPKKTSNDEVGVNPTTVMACANSSLNIFIYLLLNSEFRERFLAFLCCRRVSAGNSVVSVGPSTAPGSFRTAATSTRSFVKLTPRR
uniref:G_PROTEIN_RECEP_F1_2 domain-containing protein n=1 Tax=Steinernema glaseri TaxID=37863 RepID=A0A1I8AAY7_9BILA